MIEMTPETHIALIEKDVLNMKADQARMEKAVAVLQAERDKALLWGVITLGGMVISLVAWIASFAKDHIK